jgi:hypothetical protein
LAYNLHKERYGDDYEVSIFRRTKYGVLQRLQSQEDVAKRPVDLGEFL